VAVGVGWLGTMRMIALAFGYEKPPNSATQSVPSWAAAIARAWPLASPASIAGRL
jgi:hypothetical protein